MNMRDKITEKEYEMMNEYRNSYAWGSSCKTNERLVSVREVLAEWESSKGNLYKLFGEELTLTKTINFQKTKDELNSEMYNALDRYRCHRDTRIERKPWEFVESFRDWVDATFPHYSIFSWERENFSEEELKENDEKMKIANVLYDLTCVDTLSANVYDGEDLAITLPNGKSYTIRKGCKPMKPLAKLADAFGISGFEDFRICHSQVLNQKSVKGELSISIHPFDYWTMSDNDCGWESCMSWTNFGGYRQGTVEMMNSPCVVVAYLNADTPMNIASGEWNNKKWRCLFIVDKDVILSIKGYPYNNLEISAEVMKWLKELAETNLGWKYTTAEPIEYKCGEDVEVNEKKFKFSFTSNNMYTDVGCTDHIMYVGTQAGEFISCAPSAYYYFNYSGAAQCMCCGMVNPDLDGECYLACDCCEEAARCGECGERLYEDEHYEVEGVRMCEYCYNELANRCEWCEEDFFNENIINVRILMPVDDENLEYIEDKYSKLTETDKSMGMNHIISLCEVKYCNNCFNNKFLKTELKPNTQLVEFNDNCYGVFYTDLTKLAIPSYLTTAQAKGVLAGKNKEELLKNEFRYYWEHWKSYYELIPNPTEIN